jgi:hypothetical protein
MSDDTDIWATAIGLSAEQAEQFGRVAAELEMSPAEILKLMVERVIRLDRDVSRHALPSLKKWLSTGELADDVAEEALSGLPLNIRPSGFMWPSNKPFPWTAEECKAAVIGYEVKWPGDFDDFLNLLRGLWEMDEGYAFLKQP